MNAQEYLDQHGINQESIKRFHLTWDENILNIPIKNVDDKIIWVKKRNLKFNPDDPNNDRKYINETNTKAALFNIRSHHDKGNLILTEGEMDAIRLDQEGIPAISSTAGAGSFNQEFADQLEGKKIYIVYDNDEAGKTGIKKVLEYLKNALIIELPLDSHDICDFFNLHTKSDFKELLKGALTKEEWEIKYQKPEYSTLTVTDLYKKEYPPENYIIDKFLPSTGFTMFSGDSGVGKSWIALEVVRAITNNDIFLDHFEIKTPDIPILIIDKENGLKRLQARMKSLGVPPTDKVHLLQYPEKFNLSDEDFLQSVQNFIVANKIGIIILDSFIDILVGEENSSVDTAKVFNSLRSISQNVCWILLHHESKPMPKYTPQAGDRARGSTNIKAQLDYLFSVQRTKSLKVINIEQGKARDYEMMPKFAIEFVSLETTGEMGGFKYIGEVKDDVTKIEEAKPLIYEYIKDHPFCTKKDFNDHLENYHIKSATSKIALESLMKEKLIDYTERAGQGRKHFYFIVEGGETDETNDLAN